MNFITGDERTQAFIKRLGINGQVFPYMKREIIDQMNEGDRMIGYFKIFHIHHALRKGASVYIARLKKDDVVNAQTPITEGKILRIGLKYISPEKEEWINGTEYQFMPGSAGKIRFCSETVSPETLI